MEHALYIEFNAAGMRLSRWIALPNFTRSQSDMQYFYINGRFVKDKVLAHAMRQAYHDVLFHGRFPAYVLYLEIDPTQVDVNVHPAKADVRFRDPGLVRGLIVGAIRNALEISGMRASTSGAGAMLDLRPGRHLLLELHDEERRGAALDVRDGERVAHRVERLLVHPRRLLRDRAPQPREEQPLGALGALAPQLHSSAARLSLRHRTTRGQDESRLARAR